MELGGDRTNMNEPRSVALDRTHLAYLYQQYAPKILDYIHRHMPSFQNAEDILTDVFVAALESETFASLTEQEQKAWLWRVAHNKVIDVYRETKRIRHVALEQIDIDSIEDPGKHPEQISIRQEEDEHLALLIERLPPLQQHVLFLRFGENLRTPQIAVRIGKSEGNIRSILSRTLKALRLKYQRPEKKGGNHHGTVR